MPSYYNPAQEVLNRTADEIRQIRVRHEITVRKFTKYGNFAHDYMTKTFAGNRDVKFFGAAFALQVRALVLPGDSNVTFYPYFRLDIGIQLSSRLILASIQCRSTEITFPHRFFLGLRRIFNLNSRGNCTTVVTTYVFDRQTKKKRSSQYPISGDTFPFHSLCSRAIFFFIYFIMQLDSYDLSLPQTFVFTLERNLRRFRSKLCLPLSAVEIFLRQQILAQERHLHISYQ